MPSPVYWFDGALEAVHALGEDREEAIEDRVPRFRVELLGQLHRALHVGEQHGDLLALAFEGGLGLQDFVGEMLGRVGARVALRRRDVGGRSGRTVFTRPDQDVALQGSDALDLHQLLAELGECLRIEIEFPAERAQRYPAMALQEGARPPDRLEEAHAPSSRSVRVTRDAQNRRSAHLAWSRDGQRIAGMDPAGCPRGGQRRDREATALPRPRE